MSETVDAFRARARKALDVKSLKAALESKKRTAGAKAAATKAMALTVPRAKRTVVVGGEARFAEVVALIEAARGRAYQAVNTELVAHYWELGEYISRKIASAEWGDGVVEDLAADLARRYPGVQGYTRRNLFRMRQFYEAYHSNRKVSPLVRQLPWTHHLIILSQARPVETREFYILAAIKERWPKRGLQRGVPRASPPITQRPRCTTRCDRNRRGRCVQRLALGDDEHLKAPDGRSTVHRYASARSFAPAYFVRAITCDSSHCIPTMTSAYK